MCEQGVQQWAENCGGGVSACSHMLGSVAEEIQHPVAQVGSESQVQQSLTQLGWDDSAVIHEWQHGIAAFVVPMGQGGVECVW